MITQLIGAFMMFIGAGVVGVSPEGEVPGMAITWILIGIALFFVKGSSE